MNQTAGITIERNVRGKAKMVHIDLTKYGAMLVPFFEKVGIQAEKNINKRKTVTDFLRFASENRKIEKQYKFNRNDCYDR